MYNCQAPLSYGTRILRRIGNSKPNAIKKYKFKQRVHGDASVKPTEFMCLRLPTIEKCLYECQGGAVADFTGTLIGMNVDGTFKTAAAKEYPESLCRAIGLAIVDALGTRSTSRPFLPGAPLQSLETA